MFRTIRQATFLLGLCLVPQLGWGAIATFILESEAGDFLGGGEDFELFYDDEADPASTIFGLIPSQLNGGPSRITFTLRNPTNAVGSNDVSLIFGSGDTGEPLTIGNYDPTDRAPTSGSGNAAFDIGFQGRGYNQMVGEFNITELAFTTNGPTLTLDRFSATFAGTGTTANGPGNFSGSINFNATAVPEPTGISALCGLAGLAGFVHRRRKRRGV